LFGDDVAELRVVTIKSGNVFKEVARRDVVYLKRISSLREFRREAAALFDSAEDAVKMTANLNSAFLNDMELERAIEAAVSRGVSLSAIVYVKDIEMLRKQSSWLFELGPKAKIYVSDEPVRAELVTTKNGAVGIKSRGKGRIGGVATRTAYKGYNKALDYQANDNMGFDTAGKTSVELLISRH
jgi:hypothetical protein